MYAKCPYYLVLYMQVSLVFTALYASVLGIYCFICNPTSTHGGVVGLDYSSCQDEYSTTPSSRERGLLDARTSSSGGVHTLVAVHACAHQNHDTTRYAPF